MQIFNIIYKAIKPGKDGDTLDRINYYYTNILLILCALTLTAKQYVGAPIQCWVPAEFTGIWESYTENYCFIKNTYFLPLDSETEIPHDYRDRDAREIGYYQWVPFVLALQALMFMLPVVIWRITNWQSGINVKGIVSRAMNVQNVKTEDREKNVKTLASNLRDTLNMQHEVSGKGRFLGFACYGKRYGSYVSVLYVFTKFLFLINVIGQFFLLNSFLGFPHFSFWGVRVFNDVVHGRQWEVSGNFPRVTMCDFEVRVLGNLNKYSVQCVLMINMFNEKIFLFFWWWFVLLVIANSVSFVWWAIKTLIPTKERDFVLPYLRASSEVQSNEIGMVDKFVRTGLRPDGIFILKLISSNAGDLVVSDLLDIMWRDFKDRQQQPYAVPLPPSKTSPDEGYNTGKYTPKPVE